MTVETTSRELLSQEAPRQRAVPMPPEEDRTPAIERLHALVRKGYVAELGGHNESDMIVLRHLGRAPDLVLRGDGVVEPFDGRIPRHKRLVQIPQPFAADKVAEQLRFMKFLESVPRASLRDRTRPWRRKYVYFPLVLAALWGFSILLTGTLANL